MMRLMVSANGSSVSPCCGRSLKHGDRHATDPARVVLNADVGLVDEPSGGTFGPHRPVDGFQSDHVGFTVALVHLRQQVGVGDDCSSVALMPAFERLSGLATRSTCCRRQFEPSEHRQADGGVAPCKPSSAPRPASAPLYTAAAHTCGDLPGSP